MIQIANINWDWKAAFHTNLNLSQHVCMTNKLSMNTREDNVRLTFWGPRPGHSAIWSSLASTIRFTDWTHKHIHSKVFTKKLCSKYKALKWSKKCPCLTWWLELPKTLRQYFVSSICLTSHYFTQNLEEYLATRNKLIRTQRAHRLFCHFNCIISVVNWFLQA